MKKDFSLYSGERQVGETLDQIRFDHIARYKMAIEFLKEKQNNIGLDCFCGNGYGSYYLTKELVSTNIIGIDASEEAISFANRFYGGDRCLFSLKEFPFSLPKECFDYVVSFESVEHVDDGISMFDLLINALKPTGFFIFSVPNEKINSREKNNHLFHKHHYVDMEVKKILSGRMEILKQYGQNVYEFKDGIQGALLPFSDMNLQENIEGQVLIYVCRKKRNLWSKLFK